MSEAINFPLSSGSTFLRCPSLPSKSHSGNSISSIFLESPHQVDMKNVVKSSKQFFGYFNTLETHSEILQLLYMFSESIELKIHLLVLIDYSFFLGSLLGSDRRSTLNRKVYTKGWIERPVWKPGSKGWTFFVHHWSTLSQLKGKKNLMKQKYWSFQLYRFIL